MAFRGLGRSFGCAVLAVAALALPARAGAVAVPDIGYSIATAADLRPIASDYSRTDAMYPLELQALGREHAREHLALRNLARRLVAEHKFVLARNAPHDTAPASEIGAWTAPFEPAGADEDAMGVHAIVLHTGKVLMYSSYYNKHEGGLEAYAYVWDPIANTSTEVDPPHEAFCGGAALLSDGTVLTVGGILNRNHPHPGVPYVMRFDPVSLQWSEEPDTVLGRYYPTVTELADGRALITSGNELDASLNPTVEVFTPGPNGGRGTLTTVLDDVSIDLYPHQYVLPDGRVLIVQTRYSRILDPSTWSLSSALPLRVSRTGNPDSLLLPGAAGQPSTKVMMIGGEHGGGGVVTATTELFDDDNPTAGWAPMASLPQPRAHMNAVYLPDGTVLGVGGNSDGEFGRPEYAALRYTPETDTWTTLASQTMRRAYHSTAVLLPDGRVLSAGDTGPGGGRRTLEVYSPPYLFDGARPVITGLSHTQLDYGQHLLVHTDSAIDRVVLIHPSAITHSNDMSGRSLTLATTTRKDGTTVATMPASANTAPPGYWMLFAVNADGVPSVARFVHLGPKFYTP